MSIPANINPITINIAVLLNKCYNDKHLKQTRRHFFLKKHLSRLVVITKIKKATYLFDRWSLSLLEGWGRMNS